MPHETATNPWGLAHLFAGVPEDARHAAGNQLDKEQRGEQPDDFKPMPSIDKGVEEIRMWYDTGTYRVVYRVRLADAVYELHAFQKKTQVTQA